MNSVIVRVFDEYRNVTIYDIYVNLEGLHNDVGIIHYHIHETNLTFENKLAQLSATFRQMR